MVFKAGWHKIRVFGIFFVDVFISNGLFFSTENDHGPILNTETGGMPSNEHDLS